MKTNITLCLDHELVHALRQEGNMSSTINTLLQGHLFGGNSKEGMKAAIDDKKALIERETIKLNKLKEKLAKTPKYIVRHE